MSNIQGQVILIISNDFWGGHSYLSKHHYARVLAEMGNKVYFLNYANFQKGKGIQIEQDPDFDNIHVINYRFLFRGVRFYPPFVAKWIYKKLTKALVRAMGEKPDIVWCFDPFRFYDLKLFGARVNIYHPVDPFSTVNDFFLARSADIIFATAQLILDRYKALDTPGYQINHGLASSFLVPPSTPKKLPGSQAIKAVYIGSILRNHIDWMHLREIIKKNPQIDFIFVGPALDDLRQRVQDKNITDLQRVSQFSHVYFVGRRPFSEVKEYTFAADILLVCYDRENHADAPPNPHKMMEYFASGKLVVSNYFETYEAQRELLLMASQNRDLPQLFQFALANLEQLNSPDLQKKRIAFAKKNTYPMQVKKIEELLTRHNLLSPDSKRSG